MISINEKRIIRLKSFFLIYSVLIFLVLLFLAIALFLYPGGNYTDHFENGYSLVSNTICDLREPIAINGESNLFSSIFIKISAIIACIAMMAFFSILLVFFRENKRRMYVSRIASTIGAIFGPFYVAVIYLDSTLDWHMFFDTMTGLSLNIAVILYTILFFLQNEFSKLSRIALLILSIVSVVYSIIVAIGAIIGGEFYILANRLGSNLFINLSFVILFIEGIGNYFSLKNKK